MIVRRPATLAATSVALAVLLSACTGDPTDTNPAPVPERGTVNWADCMHTARQVNPDLPATLLVECGTVTVPQDWNTPDNGETFSIAVMRIRSGEQSDHIGSIVTNFGGPGGSGLGYLPHLAPDLNNLMERFDLVTFDPRGVGRSATVKCISDEDLDASFGYVPDPVSDASFQVAVSISRSIAEGCGAALGDRLSLYSTEQTAKDMDAIRKALGEETFDYLGYSYGTQLGAVYAQLFPATIRSMVLDGAVDLEQTPVESSEGQAMGFERALSNFSTWCSQNTEQCGIGPDARATIVDTINAADAAAVRGSDGRIATSGWVFYSVVSALYYQPSWTYLAQGIADLGDGDPTLMFLLADSYADRQSDGSYSNMFDAFNTISCIDSDAYPTVEEIRDLQAQWRGKYPVFGPALAIGLLNCALWPAKKDPYPVGPATGAPPIVVVGTLGDPATPYESTPKLAAMLGTGRVLTYEGEGHTVYPDDDCIRRAVDAYLIDLTVPAEGTSCPSS
jgi:pimeloyl-ACP methyl ester carboxylesterase